MQVGTCHLPKLNQRRPPSGKGAESLSLRLLQHAVKSWVPFLYKVGTDAVHVACWRP